MKPEVFSILPIRDKNRFAIKDCNLNYNSSTKTHMETRYLITSWYEMHSVDITLFHNSLAKATVGTSLYVSLSQLVS